MISIQKQLTIPKIEKPFYIDWFQQDISRGCGTAPNKLMLSNFQSKFENKLQIVQQQIQESKRKIKIISDSQRTLIPLQEQRLKISIDKNQGDQKKLPSPMMKTQQIFQPKFLTSSINKYDQQTKIIQQKECLINRNIKQLFNKKQFIEKQSKTKNNNQISEINLPNSQNRPSSSFGNSRKKNNKSQQNQIQKTENQQQIFRNRDIKKISNTPSQKNILKDKLDIFQNQLNSFTMPKSFSNKNLQENNYLKNNNQQNEQISSIEVSPNKELPYKIIINQSKSARQSQNVQIKFQTKLDQDFLNLFAQK